MAFQQRASDRINLGLRERHPGRRVADDLNMLFRQSFS